MAELKELISYTGGMLFMLTLGGVFFGRLLYQLADLLFIWLMSKLGF